MIKNIQYWVWIFYFGLTISGYSQNLSIDERLGEEYSNTIEKQIGLYQNKEINLYIDSLGLKMLQYLDEPTEFDYAFKLLDMPEPNAFALPGGHIYLTRGILGLANNEDELAGVIAHEIIHTEERHTVKHMKKSILPSLLLLPAAITGALFSDDVAKVFTPLNMGSKAIINSYSRNHEKKADKKGMKLMAKAGYDPLALASVLNKLSSAKVLLTGEEEKRSYLNKHPYTPRRLKYINKLNDDLKIRDHNAINEGTLAYYSLIKGLVCEKNPGQGVFHNNTFVHPELNIQFTLPNNWKRQNTAETVAAFDSTGGGLIYFEPEKLYNAADTAIKYVEPKMIHKFGKEHIKTMSLDINGHPAQLISIVNYKDYTPYYLFVLWIEHHDNLYRFIGAGTEDYSSAIKRTAESFRTLSEENKASITNKVIEVATSKQQESLENLSNRTNNAWDVKTTAIMNGIDKDQPLKKGKPIKIAVEVPYESAGK